MNNLMYATMNAAIRVKYVAVSVHIHVECVIRRLLEREIW